MAARRLYEPPFTDNAPSGPDYFFSDADVDAIIVVLDEVRANATSPSDRPPGRRTAESRG